MKPIKELFLRGNNLLALEFREGFIFSRVIRYVPFVVEPYSGVGSISADSASDKMRLNYTTGGTQYDILYISEKVPKVIQAGIGIFPSFVKMYIYHPEEGSVINTPPNVPSPEPSKGTEYGRVTGKESPYDNPTDMTELWIPPVTHVKFKFYNPEDYQVEPLLNVVGRVYCLEILNPEDRNVRVREYAKDIIRKMAKRVIPCAFGVVGNPESPMTYTPQIKRSFDDVEPISLRKAQML